MSKLDACLTSKTNEHYTPLTFLIRVYEFYDGVLDLDPCSDDKMRVFANMHYTKEINGLALPWWGKVFVNPPYGRSLPEWTKKVIEEYESGRADQILYLVPSRTDTQWTRMLNAYPRCYLHSRLRFTDEQGNEQDSAPFPSALFYLGARREEFASYWQSIGDVYKAEGNKRKTFDRTAYYREYMRKRRAAAKLSKD